ncbi:Oxysterol-binding protein [Xylariaceae sp. FL0016]|nr:Oxysterol-binding protein [Xylariaceae sp. FL0016]
MSLPMSPVRCEEEKREEQQHKSAWFQFIKSVATFKGDLTSLTAPPFLLAPQSIVEYSTFWAEHPALFVAPARAPDPEQRALRVLQWFLSTLRHQHASRDDAGRRKKLKPLNPFLGELFLGCWEGDGNDEAKVGTTHMISEQVSHHPPVTAYRIWNDGDGDGGVELTGHIAPKAYFSSTINIERRGYSLLRIGRHDETHWITMPRVHVEGLVTLQIAPELSGTSHIRSSSGYTTRIEYAGKGWLRGKSHSFVATICRDADKSDPSSSSSSSPAPPPLYVLEGQWDGTYTVKDGRGKLLQTIDLAALRRTPLRVAPLECQHPLESRRAWRRVIDGINDNDIFAVGHEKSRIENAQRALRREERDEGRTWERRYFTEASEDPVRDRLAVRSVGSKGKGAAAEVSHDSGMVWMFDADKFRRIEEGRREGIKSPTHARFDSGVGLSCGED